MYSYDICIVSSRSDRETAGILAESIRRYRLPAGIVPSDGLDYRRIIADTEETAFGEEERKRLDESRFLVFLCSAEAKNSSVLNERLEYFRTVHDREHIIAVLVRDEPAEAFPSFFIERKTVRHIMPDQRVIEREETIEPVAADLRADNEKRRKQLLRYETVRIAASVLGMHPDDLEQRQKSRQRKTLIRLLSFAAAVTLIISGIFTVLGIRARREGRIAESQTRLSVQTAQRTMHELPEMFADEPEALEYIDEAVRDARDALAEIGMEGLLEQAEEGEE